MFDFSTNGLLSSLAESKKKPQTAQSKIANSTAGQERLNEMRAKKDSENLEEQTDLLKKIHRDGGKSGKGGLNGGAVVTGGGAVAFAKSVLKKLGITGAVATLFTVLNKGIAKETQKIAEQLNKNIDELSLTEKIKGLGKALENSVITNINSLLGLIGVDYRIDSNVISDALSKMSGTVSEVFKTFVNNTGDFGKGLSFLANRVSNVLGRLDNAIGEKLSSVVDTISELGDVFLSQTSDHKKFISLTKKMRKIEGSKGFVSDKDSAEYNKIKQEATSIAHRLKENKTFTNHSGYANDAKALTNALMAERKATKQQENKLAYMTRGIMGNGSIFGVGGYSKEEIAKQIKITDRHKMGYLDSKIEREGGVSKAERKQYANARNRANEATFADVDKALQSKKEVLAQLDLIKRGIDTQKKQQTIDKKNNDIYQNNIDNATKQQIALNKELSEINATLQSLSYNSPLAGNAGVTDINMGKISSSDKDFLYMLGQTESKGNYNTGKNANGYEGKYQFRFRDKGDAGTILAKKMGKTPEQIRRSPQLQEQMMAVALKGYDKDITNSGLEVNNWNRWLRHNQGAGGMRSINRGKLSKTVRRNIRNQSIKGNTDAELIANYKKKFMPKFLGREIKQSPRQVSIQAKVRNRDELGLSRDFTTSLKSTNQKVALDDGRIIEAISSMRVTNSNMSDKAIVAELVKLNARVAKEDKTSKTEVTYTPTRAYKEIS
ncbi:MAG TPA: hypothetical protein EYG70_00855 [Sulfurimonas sp.]|nr:hypothetical protein [Sulfurimonas sp.]